MVKKFALIALAALPVLAHTTEQPKTICMYLFVHGIMNIEAHLNTSTFIHLFNDDIEDTLYKANILYVRNDPFFQQSQPIQGLGLIPIDMNKTAPGYAAGAMAQLFEQQLPKDQGCEHKYYTFGWSSLLSFSERYKAAQQLYYALSQEVQKYTQEGHTVRLMAVGYSHGANILLNLAAIKKENTLAHEPFSIDTLVLMGAPIQCETDHQIMDPLYKKVYHLYSNADVPQTLDFFTSKRFFSERMFRPRKGFVLPNKLVQANISILRRAGGNHKKLPCKKVNCKSQLMRDISPGHTELWFFGWTQCSYRPNLPFCPLPLATLIPTFIKYLQRVEPELDPNKTAYMTIDTYHDTITIKNNRKGHIVLQDKWINNQVTDYISLANQFKPSYTKEIYQKRRQAAFDKARDWHKNYVKQQWYAAHCPRTVSQICNKSSN
ncbi:hypothetical protein Noda2021_09320 [Candidatus Dependentiae bacterium Noda2021]|nr:hypothetical protein Noda2021_09320 [Candidatus Dependentiae bacterium Noda2021]